jgi:hypothetical protein
MADAPSGGDWGVFEIVLGLLLVSAILSNIGNKGKPYKPLEVADSKQEIVSPKGTSDANKCGLSITSPLSLQKTTNNSIRLAGSVNGCKWKPNGDTALFAQIITGAGVPISEFVSVQDNKSDLLKNAFDTVISTTGSYKGTGYIILVPALQEEGQSITVRIPITIVRN